MKLSTTYYTLPEAVTVPVGKVLNPDTLPQAPQVMTVEYCGHMDKTTIGDSTSYCLHLPNGYISMDSLHTIVDWSYFRCDHLGNNVAVWSATADSTTQRTFYYPSGLPMAISTGQSAQPYKYNGKEFVEMHGYDVYDYGFRGYYATIARFTSIDPLCEQTPWQSPYGYASNNFTGEIDWMGLFGSGGFVSGNSMTCHWVAIDVNGIVLDFDLSSPDKGVYLVDDDEWDGTYIGLLAYTLVGKQIEHYQYYKGGLGKYDSSNGGYYNEVWGCFVPYGKKLVEDASFLLTIFTNPAFKIGEDDLALIISIMETAGVNYEYVKFLKKLSGPLMVVEALDIYNRYQKDGITSGVAYDAIMLTINFLTKNPYVLGGLLIIDSYKMACEEFINQYNQLNSHFNDFFGTWGNMYMNGDYGFRPAK